jgi:hypothetical protein
MMISPVHAPIIFANGQAYQVQGQFAIPLPPNEVRSILLNDISLFDDILVKCICAIGSSWTWCTVTDR